MLERLRHTEVAAPAAAPHDSHPHHCPPTHPRAACPPRCPPGVAGGEAALRWRPAGGLVHQLLPLQRRPGHAGLWRARGRRAVGAGSCCGWVPRLSDVPELAVLSAPLGNTARQACAQLLCTVASCLQIATGLAHALHPATPTHHPPMHRPATMQGAGGAAGGLPRQAGRAGADPGDCAGGRQHPLHHPAAASGGGQAVNGHPGTAAAAHQCTAQDVGLLLRRLWSSLCVEPLIGHCSRLCLPLAPASALAIGICTSAAQLPHLCIPLVAWSHPPCDAVV